MTPGARRVAVVDDHPAISAGIPAGLRELFPQPLEFVNHTTVATVLSDPAGYHVVVLDLQLADGSSPEANVRALAERALPVVLYTQQSSSARLASCLAAGALAVVGKHQDWPVLADAIAHALTGEPYLNTTWAAALRASGAPAAPALTRRESEVLRLYAAGLPLRSVADRVGVAEATAREYLKRIRTKYDQAGRPAPTKTHLFRRAVEDGHLSESDGVLDDPLDPRE